MSAVTANLCFKDIVSGQVMVQNGHFMVEVTEPDAQLLYTLDAPYSRSQVSAQEAAI